MNCCTFAGRVVADAVLRATQSGTQVLTFRVASDTGYGDHKKTHWLGCKLFGKRGVSLAPYLLKGQQVTVAGTLEPPRTYDAQGETRLAQDLVVSEVALMGQQPQTNGTSKEPAAAPEFDDDIPF